MTSSIYKFAHRIPRRIHSAMSPITDYLGVQMLTMSLVGFVPVVWSLSSAVPYRVQRIVNVFYGKFVYLVHFHLCVCFSVSLFGQIKTGHFAGISYLFSQTIIWFHNSIVLLMMQWRAADVAEVRELVNRTFRYRSAKGFF